MAVRFEGGWFLKLLLLLLLPLPMDIVRDRLLDWQLVWIEDVGFRSVDGRPI